MFSILLLLSHVARCWTSRTSYIHVCTPTLSVFYIDIIILCWQVLDKFVPKITHENDGLIFNPLDDVRLYNYIIVEYNIVLQ